jgi:hypothetical protein
MRIAQIIRESLFDPMLLDGVDMTTYENFMASLGRIPRDQLVKLNDILKSQRAEVETKYAGWTTLYHGTPPKLYEIIKKDGFKLTQGKRTVGGMGATIIVDNQGIFLTDSPNIAAFFGSNRSDNGQYQVINTQVDTSRVMDSDKADLELRKLGLALVNKYNGTVKTKLALKDWWWLVDKVEFINQIKSGGHTGVRFKEEASTRKAANAFDGHTYCIFDLSTIRIMGSGVVSTQSFYGWLKTNM